MPAPRPSILSRVRKAWRSFTLLDDEAVSAFSGARGGRLFMDWPALLRSADDEVRAGGRTLRARARSLERSNPYVQQYLRIITANVLGPSGVAMSAPDQLLEDTWYEWGAEPVTIDGRSTHAEFQHLLLRTVARDGEAFVRLWHGFGDSPWRFALEAIDADQVDEALERRRSVTENEIRMGVEVDQYNRPVAYHVGPPQTVLHPGGGAVKRIPSSQILHIHRPDRVNQTRSPSWLASVIGQLKLLDGYMEAELVAARTASAKQGFFVQKEPGGEGASIGAPQTLTMDASPGVLERLGPGIEFQGWDPTHPTTAFPFFIKAILRSVAAGLGVTFESLANDRESVNYSSIRTGTLLERDLCRELQAWWIDCYLVPVFRAWVASATLSPELTLYAADPTELHRDVIWTPRGYDWVDPQNEAAAAETLIKLGLTSRTRYMNERGLDRSKIFEELREEKADAERLGIDIAGSKGANAGPATGAAPDEPAPNSNGNGNGNGSGKAHRLSPYIGGVR